MMGSWDEGVGDERWKMGPTGMKNDSDSDSNRDSNSDSVMEIMASGREGKKQLRRHDHTERCLVLRHQYSTLSNPSSTNPTTSSPRARLPR